MFHLRALMALVFAAYANFFHNGFHFDDAHVIVENGAIHSLAHWTRFFEIAGAAQYATDPRFDTPARRSQNIHALYAILAELVAQRTTAEWQALLQAADIPMAPIASPDDLLADAHLQATGFFREEDHPTEGRVRTAGIPVVFSRTPGAIRTLAPRLGADGEAIREELEKGR